MSGKTHPDGVCQCCGRVGPTVADLDHPPKTPPIRREPIHVH